MAFRLPPLSVRARVQGKLIDEIGFPVVSVAGRYQSVQHPLCRGVSYRTDQVGDGWPELPQRL